MLVLVLLHMAFVLRLFVCLWSSYTPCRSPVCSFCKIFRVNSGIIRMLRATLASHSFSLFNVFVHVAIFGFRQNVGPAIGKKGKVALSLMAVGAMGS